MVLQNDGSSLQLYGKVEGLEYKGHRYDEEMYKVLKEFKEDGVLKGTEKSNSLFRKSICYLNKTRKKVNLELCEIFGGEEAFFQKHKCKYKVAVGTPVITLENLKKEKRYNNEIFDVVRVASDKVCLSNGMNLDKKTFFQIV